MKELCVPAKLEQLNHVLAFVANELDGAGCKETVKTQVMVAVEEIFVNIASYAYPGQEGMATIRMQITGVPAIVQVDMLDQGIPYNPLQQKAPDVTLPVQERAIGGLGIFMVRQTMDELCYRYENRYNILTMRKALDG